MVTPEEFPYITAVHVNDCYADKDFGIKLHDYKPFSHLILTGKNGSGKSTILRSISARFSVNSYGNPSHVDILFKYSQNNELNTYQHFAPVNIYNERLITFFQAKRESKFNPVNSPTRQDQFNNYSLSSELFLQYLVNKKVNQAFDQLDGNQINVQQTNIFFQKIEAVLRRMFDDNELELLFKKESYVFLLSLSGGHQVTFDLLPEGFSAFTSILLDLLIRTDLIRSSGDFTYDPCGIVLIDEPETHLHLKLQEQVLPILTELFPNIQFIVATHSPAVIASIKNATIFDLTTKETRTSEDMVSQSYSELTVSHFGLENDYSAIADRLFAEIDSLVDTFGNEPSLLKNKLVDWRKLNNQLLSPTFQVKLEYLIAQQEAKLAVAR